jgi:hypothetical protein
MVIWSLRVDGKISDHESKFVLAGLSRDPHSFLLAVRRQP